MKFGCTGLGIRVEIHTVCLKITISHLQTTFSKCEIKADAQTKVDQSLQPTEPAACPACGVSLLCVVSLFQLPAAGSPCGSDLLWLFHESVHPEQGLLG